MGYRRRQRQPREDATSGFTMIELLVTMLLLTIVLIGLAALQVSTIRQVTVSKRASEATRLAQMVLERYKSMPYLDLVGFSPKRLWYTELQRDEANEMVNVGVDGESRGPFTVQTLHESIGGGELVTARVKWTSVNRGVESAPSQQYRQLSVTMSLQRYQ